MIQINQELNYRSVLGLGRDPFSPEPDAKFYYPFDSFEQRLHVLDHLVQGTDLLVLVIGEIRERKNQPAAPIFGYERWKLESQLDPNRPYQPRQIQLRQGKNKMDTQFLSSRMSKTRL